ncbi:hypothetical protein Scep_029819 [Stephania cephalantha]|uniref:Uncharacterized protein n=1 Tax=Stephania cephalantha TaxID=152367 RepID=A0AAP0E675_9MAGN
MRHKLKVRVCNRKGVDSDLPIGPGEVIQDLKLVRRPITDLSHESSCGSVKGKIEEVGQALWGNVDEAAANHRSNEELNHGY